ncbi:hypothetical protein [Hoylesella saccharolytica]|uniref:hypothetical protein n=1 Tax=Hoylesella saccharolytica TaxID=633701 RepID=UPI0028F08319|nr:hypothetical protein [Hoylesella saccharolytica]
MKRLNSSTLLIATLLMLTGCAEEAATQQDNGKSNQQEPGTKGLTAFVVEENDTKTRTTAEYFDNGGLNRGLHYYWTAGDRLWVNNGGTLIQDASNNISDILTNNTTTPGGVKRASKASFSFEGNFTAPSYPVRYTGTGSTAGDKVTIKAQQTQTIPNDASHIGEDGDCGTAVATKPAGGSKYFFTLKHKAAYATFLPYNAPGAIGKARMTSIVVTADQPLAGTYNFTDNGLDLTSPTTPSNTITLRLDVNPNGGFSLPQTATPAINAATMVIAPGTYTNFKVQYCFGSDIIEKTYPSVTFIAGRNKKISQDMQIMDYSTKFYMWDAKYHYWYNHLKPDGTPDNISNYPLNNSDPRWYHEGTAPLAATPSCKDCPNVNELYWYIKKGDPHLGSRQQLVYYDGRLQPITVGLWLRKKSAIVAYLKANEGYPASLTWNDMKEAYWDTPTAPHVDGRTTSVVLHRLNIPSGTPANPADYFFIPMVTGYIKYGMLVRPSMYNLQAHYWSSTAVPGTAGLAYCFRFDADHTIHVLRFMSCEMGLLAIPFE